MKISSIKYFAAVLMAFGLVACSDDSKDAVSNIRNEPQLQGTFHDTCSSSKILGVSEVIKVSFEGNKYTRSQIFFNEADCQQESGRITYTGTFKAGEMNEDPRKGGTLDLDVQDVRIKVADERLATILNGINYCGHNDFGVNREVVVSGQQTQGICPLENVPVKLYTVYKFEGGRLYLGNPDITTMAGEPESRTSEVSFEKGYVREEEQKTDAGARADAAKQQIEQDAKVAQAKAKEALQKAKVEAQQATDKVEAVSKDAAKDVEQAAKNVEQKAKEEAKR